MARNLAASSTILNWVEKKLTSPAGGPRVGVIVAAGASVAGASVGASVATSVGASVGASVTTSVGACVAVACGPQAVRTKAATTSMVKKIRNLFISLLL